MLGLPKAKAAADSRTFFLHKELQNKHIVSSFPFGALYCDHPSYNHGMKELLQTERNRASSFVVCVQVCSFAQGRRSPTHAFYQIDTRSIGCLSAENKRVHDMWTT